MYICMYVFAGRVQGDFGKWRFWGRLPFGAPFHAERGVVERRRERRSPSKKCSGGSVPEMAHAGEDHGDAGVVGGFDDVFVLLAAARLGDGSDAGLGGFDDAVRE